MSALTSPSTPSSPGWQLLIELPAVASQASAQSLAGLVLQAVGFPEKPPEALRTAVATAVARVLQQAAQNQGGQHAVLQVWLSVSTQAPKDPSWGYFIVERQGQTGRISQSMVILYLYDERIWCVPTNAEEDSCRADTR